MPIPFILGGIAVAAGLVGAKKALDASDKNARARRMNRRAQETFENAKKELLAARDEAGKALENLGQAKVDILHGSVTRFVDTFGKIHHVELADSVGMDELAEFTVNEDALKEMGELGSLASKMVSGTVEGLAAGEDLSPLQAAFKKHHALQCGFCTPGILTTMHSLLMEEPEADEERIRDVLSGNICRCTGYRPILDAFYSFCSTDNGSKSNGVEIRVNDQLNGVENGRIVNGCGMGDKCCKNKKNQDENTV